jgi:hypothetical protein
MILLKSTTCSWREEKRGAAAVKAILTKSDGFSNCNDFVEYGGSEA